MIYVKGKFSSFACGIKYIVWNYLCFYSRDFLKFHTYNYTFISLLMS